MVSVIDVGVQVGAYLLPIALWLSVFALLKYYITKSNMSETGKVALFWFLAVTSLAFLVIYRIRAKAAHKARQERDDDQSGATVNINL